MTDRKQEAIKAIAEMMSEELYQQPPYDEECLKRMMTVAERFYPRIAPLMMREFPDEVLKDLLDLLPANEALFWKIKCLWEGQEPRIGDNVLEQEEETTDEVTADISRHLQANRGKKGICRTCGGSGQKWPHGNSQQCSCSTLSYTHKCPDCKGTGEDRRDGVERRAGEEAKCNKIPISKGKTLLFGGYIDPYKVDPIEGGWSEDRRALPERRKGKCQHKGGKGWMITPKRTGMPRCFDCGAEVDRRDGVDRRDVCEGRRVYDGEDHENHLGGLCVDRRALPDRRRYKISAEFMYDKPEGICEGAYTDSEGHLKKDRRDGIDRRIGKGRREYDNSDTAQGTGIDRRSGSERRKAGSD